ncbi:MAG: ATP-binding protein [Nostoc sp. ChiQUE02]|uniref:ATP-binding protein n=1 Tax=Nostoc sp. ChiQUE02 TaxID=3075377 RepID=UPI002AD504ED|nr:ATP-binding protein [Nostoc sp. ChiQUE02]MDZ8234852.1 ATP-binding protein [Nostoc sp. ChiQUE02]
MDTTFTTNWYDTNYSYLLAAAEQVNYSLALHVAQIENQPPATKPESSLAALKDAMLAPPALEQLCNIFQLSKFERDILLLCVARELMPNFKSLCIKAQGDEKLTLPTFSLVRNIFSTFNWSALTPQAPLQYWQLVQVQEGDTLMESTLKIDQRIFYYLLGEPSLDPQLTGILQPIPLGVAGNNSLPASHQRIAEQLAKIWMQPTDVNTSSLIQLCGADNTALRQIAIAASAFVEYNLGVISAKHLTSDSTKLQAIIRRIEREVILNNCIILLDCFNVFPGDTVFIQTISHLTENSRIPLVITSRERLPLTQETYLTFDVPKLTTNEQLAIWQDALGASLVELNPSVETLVSQFHLSQEGIYTAVSTAKGIINTNPVSPGDTNKEATILWDSCRIQARPQLDDLASRINTNATWDDLVLPDQQQQLLREMIVHVQHRLTVYEKWGFANKSDRGLGIAALFSGISGTGKTMSAEVIANELRLDLYRIDLSAVVSKYIGETEKNLRRIFDAAEAGGAVLLFDEADALFSKRTEVKDSHDRNANLETNYLLQRLEAYQGLAILTTNLRNSIDSAFMRRIRFVVEFEFPTPEIREQIWQQIFPKDTPTLQLDYAKLARLNVPGGNIRSIAMNAAFLAAAAAEPVQMKHLLSATISEGRKTGLSLGNHTKGWV